MKYIVHASVTVGCWTEVEAGSKEEATEIAEQRELGQLTINSIYPEVNECFHFEGDGTPYDLVVEEA